jgi:hypothetical protein
MISMEPKLYCPVGVQFVHIYLQLVCIRERGECLVITGSSLWILGWFRVHWHLHISPAGPLSEMTLHYATELSQSLFIFYILKKKNAF